MTPSDSTCCRRPTTYADYRTLLLLRSMTSITTLFNCSALFAYLFAVALLGEDWAARKVIAVGLATVGVTVVAYGGSEAAEVQEITGACRFLSLLLRVFRLTSSLRRRSKFPVDRRSACPLGRSCVRLLPLRAVPRTDAWTPSRYGLYEVGYKKWIAFDSIKNPPGSAPSPVLPFALHPNLITSLIGICTIAILLPFFPILHFAGLEDFESPWSFAAGRPAVEGTPLGLTLAVVLCGSLGVLYNGAFMICLSLWGPVVGASHSNQHVVRLRLILPALSQPRSATFSPSSSSPSPTPSFTRPPTRLPCV